MAVDAFEKGLNLDDILRSYWELRVQVISLGCGGGPGQLPWIIQGIHGNSIFLNQCSNLYTNLCANHFFPSKFQCFSKSCLVMATIDKV
jgi:hypothetical protein